MDAPNVLVRQSLFDDNVGKGLEEGFPFEHVLSFASVVAHWQKLSEDNPERYAAAWAGIERDLAAAPELLEPVTDPDVLDTYSPLVARLARPLFPSSDWTTSLSTLSGPFGGGIVYHTEGLERALGHRAEGVLNAINQHDVYIRTLYAYRAILAKFYGVAMRLDIPVIYTATDDRTGICRYFKFVGNTRFSDVVIRDKLPALTPQDIRELLHKVDDFHLWKAKLPPHVFQFVGLSVTTLVDVTTETATAAITHLILTSDANVTDQTVDRLESEMRTLFKDANLRLGIASFQIDGGLNLTSERRMWNSLVLRNALRAGTITWRATPYHTVKDSDEAVIFADVESTRLDDRLHRVYSELGVRSLVVKPLRYANQTVGLLELTSPEADAIDASTLLKMRSIAPIFALAAYQNRQRFETRVETTIQQAYTAIHPSVQWRFREAAIAMLEDPSAEPAPVIFEQVSALYGAADIRASSLHRNEAVRYDTLARLGRAHKALETIRKNIPLIILDELCLRIDARIAQYETAWNTGDETAAYRFLQEDVEPVLRRMTKGRDDLANVMTSYETLGANDEVPRSDAYEESRRAINWLVTDVLLTEQAEAQALYPHYFEQTQSDGVEHTMYIGASITPSQPFDVAYVQNLRLRQLITACTIADEVRSLNKTLPMSLDIAQLIVVQHAPITLHFRNDETRFDVDGASGVRFELLKKRLDKALIKNSDERISQPDTIAVVYSTEAEETEYLRYASYLAANGYIKPDPETLYIENLPGAAGLKFLRLRTFERVNPSSSTESA